MARAPVPGKQQCLRLKDDLKYQRANPIPGEGRIFHDIELAAAIGGGGHVAPYQAAGSRLSTTEGNAQGELV
ncbi:hypothetical protein ALQ33_01866 [Pseudomonas syringae pv. philadelphi]|uniref:Uncharacterized protein n=1 Tax=Pseudomonas syringae pv. philadelphi TaxID=251706 RepID=A0A3M3YAM2_9PSED|nr:hypothetical protein ALQ33_01866 [Pseudomonas syringae pv. philadelphi]